MTIEEISIYVKQLQNGDESAFDILFNEYKVKAVRTAALISGDTSLAEDIAQEAFVKAFLNIKSLKNPERFKPWFFHILTRCAWRAVDKRNRLIPMEEIYETAESSLPPVIDCYPFENYAAYEVLYKAIDALGKKQRTTVVLYYFNGLSIKEIAQVTSSLEASVKSRLYVAKKQLKDSLKGCSLREGDLIYEKG